VTAPEIAVSGNGVNIVDGDTTPSTSDGTDFGTVAQGATDDRVFTVSNTGTSALTTSGLTLPSGFTLIEGLSASIAAGSSDTFTVRMDTSSTGARGGQITFVDNDSNENPFNFSVTGMVSPPVTAPHANDLTYSSTASGFNHFIDFLNFEASYPDLIHAFGLNQQAMQTWYTYNEPIERRIETFDGLDYIASYGDLINAFRSGGSLRAVQDLGATHFIANGLAEGRTTTFNGLDYIASHSDLIAAFGANNDAGAFHYIEYGRDEGRTTTFDGLNYIANYTDLMTAFGANEQAGAAHFIGYGLGEGRSNSFDVAGYEAAHPDLQGRFGTDDQFLTAYINNYVTTGQFLT
jgi:hypothetical protein